MPPHLYIVRHGQGFHNLTGNPNILDPLLTPEGKDQCRALCESFQDHDKIDLVVTSPLRRTIQTASLSFGPVLARSVPFVAVPEAQEVGSHNSDKGLPPAQLKEELKTLFEGDDLGFDINKLDLSNVKDGWNSKTGYWAWNKEAIGRRAADLRKWLYTRPEKRVILVTHGAFVHFLTEDLGGMIDYLSETAWKNCELRQFVFTETSTADDPHLVETAESRQSRGQAGKEEDPHVLEDMKGAVDHQVERN
ncbi:phosphoglycerate mutase family protein-like protein [Westerdykella ornata]|uniref:Phosphoglycerate mutase family protein-like protein n=1 Tax=Westerdykella ornata TaxID=318751 RepID=A0A6A6JEJ8_WESOR|nr:phosphoglycerate mutase family protein-like protein [Westerdykella ornata]KAF2274086.1 phosphoglycerate mutase family protein-like protein [Westerdykella ornata]